MTGRLTAWMIAGGVALAAAAGVAAVGEQTPIKQESGAASTQFDRIAAELAARAAAVERRELAYNEHEAVLRAAEARLAERVAQLEAVRGEIEALKLQVDAERSARILTVVKAIEAMKPAAAAGMVAELDPALAIEVLCTMNRAKAGKVLGLVPAPLGAQLAEGMAARRAPILPGA